MPFYYEPPYVLASGIVLIIVCAVLTCLRFVARLRAVKNSILGLDDWLTVPATIFVVGCGVVMIVGVQLEVLAYPNPDPDLENYYFSTVQKLQYAFLSLQILSLGCTKLSLVAFYRRIFLVGSRRSPFALASTVVGICVICWIIVFFLWLLFDCPSDLAARWTNPTTFAEVCTTDTQASDGLVISDFITDVAVVALPIVPVLRLHLRWRSKILILAIFAIGFVVVAISAVRMVFVIEAAYALVGGVSAALLTTTEFDLTATEVFYWSMIEAGLALIVCCLPTLNTLLSLPSVKSLMASLRNLSSRRSSQRLRDGNPGNGPVHVGSAIELPLRSSVSSTIRQGSSASVVHKVYSKSERLNLSVASRVPKLGVRVHHTVEQTSSAV